MKKLAALLLIAVCCILFSACNSEENKTENTAPVGTTAKETTHPEATTVEQITNTATTKAIEETTDLQMMIGNTSVSVDWEDNESVQSLKELCRNQPLAIQMSMYGGFEQVGSIDKALPQNDMQTTTSAGDIVLYSGNQMVVFYGSNSWAYTRLGHITDKTAEEMSDLLSNGDTTITIGF